jgi:hypothetical protein
MSFRRFRRRMVRKYSGFMSLGAVVLLFGGYMISQKVMVKPSPAPAQELQADVKIRSTVDGQICVYVCGGNAKKNQLYVLQTQTVGQADVSMDLKNAKISFKDAYLFIQSPDKKNVLLSLSSAPIPANIAGMQMAIKQTGYGIGEHISPEYYAEVSTAINSNMAKLPAFAPYLCKCLSKSISDSQCYMGGLGSSSCSVSDDEVHFSKAVCDTSFYVCCSK